MMARRSVLVVLLVMLCQQQSDARTLQQTDSGIAAGPRRVVAQAEPASASESPVLVDSVIVSFKITAGTAAFAGKRLIDRINALSSGAAVHSGTDSDMVWSVLEASPNLPLAARDSSTGSSELGVGAQQVSSTTQAIVIRGISEKRKSIVLQSDDVEAMVPDLKVHVPDGMAPATMDLMSITAARRCASAPQINSGVASNTAPVAGLGWPGPLAACGTGTYAVWVAERCGKKWNLLEYKAIYAISKTTKQLKKVNGRDCVLFPVQADKAKWFGSCGVSPRGADMPTTFCSAWQSCIGAITSRAAIDLVTSEAAAAVAPGDADTDTTLSAAAAAAAAAANPAQPPAFKYTTKVTLKRPMKCGNGNTTMLTLYGNACGPNKAYVQWMRATAPGCTFVRDNSRTGFKTTHALLGSCGASPAISDKIVPSDVCGKPPEPSPSPSPSPDPINPIDDLTPLAKVAVADGEEVPRGVSMIEAVTNGGACTGAKCVDDVSSVPDWHRVIVGVADSGVDEWHPDLNYSGGMSWLGPDDQPGIDQFGHGTHVAGIISAKNNGQGVVGVSPGIGVYSLKILDSQGNGVLSDAMRVIKWATSEREGAAKGIKVINFSLAGHVDPTASYYNDMVKMFCGVCQEASDAGITIVAAAGNDGRSIKEYIPAVCPTVITVSALDQDGTKGADWSNYADAADTDAKAHTLAAPGTAIVSTVPKSVVDTGYMELGGTSMASPHIAGVAANCIMCGKCNSTGADTMAKLQESAVKRLDMAMKDTPPLPWVSYTPTPVGGRYYGNLVWSGF